MTKVFVLMQYVSSFNDSCDILGVYIRREPAEERMAKLQEGHQQYLRDHFDPDNASDLPDSSTDWEILEMEVIE